MLAEGAEGRAVVGRVEAVDPEGITLTPLDDGEAPVVVLWDDVVCLMQSGPDRDAELLAARDRWQRA